MFTRPAAGTPRSHFCPFIKSDGVTCGLAAPIRAQIDSIWAEYEAEKQSFGVHALQSELPCQAMCFKLGNCHKLLRSMERERLEQCDVAPLTDIDSPKCMPLLDLDTLKNPTTTAEDSSDGDDEQPNSAERLIDLLRHDSDSASEGEDGEPAGAVDLLLRRASTDAATCRSLVTASSSATPTWAARE